MRRKRIARRKRLIRFCILLTTIIVLLIVVATQRTPHTEGQKEVSMQKNDTTKSQEIKNKSIIEQTITNALETKSGEYSIVFLDLTTDEVFALQEHQVYAAASLYKLWIMGTTYDQIERGVLTEETVVEMKREELYKAFPMASDSAQPADETITLTVSEALEKMITVSDNEAALLLSKKIRLSNVSAFLKKQGLSESHLGKDEEYPETTAFDMGLFFKKLYQGKLANKQNTEAMISLLQRQRLNSKIPKYLPKEIKIAHKTGELDKFTHDAGIIYTPQGNYILVILGEGNNRQTTNEEIATLSKEIYSIRGKN